MHKANYELSVLVNGRPVREFFHKDRFLIESRDGTEYTLKLKNHSHKRIMAVVSVDGIDVLKGKSAADAESGYIINAFSTTEIKGYRIDDNNVAIFRFSDGKKSYATEVEQKFDKKKIEKVKRGELAPAKNNGVIGVRIWEEKDAPTIPAWTTPPSNPNYYTWQPDYSIHDSSIGTGCSNLNYSFNGSAMMNTTASGCLITNSNNIRSRWICQSDLVFTGPSYTSTVNAFYNNIPISDVNQFGDLGAITSVKLSNPGYTPNFNMGTSWGAKQEDKVVKVVFVKSDKFIDLEIYYLSRKELVDWGVDLENSKKIFVSGFPKAFSDGGEYCKQPNNWGNE